ncbi:hypothetical protein FA95DRAFT_1554244 [Auriscalpium vulgare]|uniref:Uncharacterized protein n=1 Tax=Auriscalpium vulgare TaxID=40419 RepID=A0ACB8S7E4_9AGAM|nr:hypothetical protein FA95DRAFT_1554244 [Auriscalpium vulgare]
MADTRSSSHLKRRLTSPASLDFFTPSATSFQPRPYNPNSSAALPLPKPPPPARNHSLTHPLPPMDPSISDPNAVFIRPPFTSFPDAHHHPEGLTYSLMAANPDWFLIASDFVSTQVSTPDAVPYLSQLEPPRGWCPAKKKDLKERGADGWPEGEEPRLRCTFCRRTYAGVNAKSMWRRHVFEKHKIAMANRRDNTDRSRKSGRGETKERHEKENHSSGRQGRGASSQGSKSRLRSLRPAASTSTSALFDRGNGFESAEDDDDMTVPNAPRIPEEAFAVLEPAVEVSRPPLSQSSSRASATPPPDSPRSESPEFLGYPIVGDAPPTPIRPILPASPYNPLSTPSFRHSPPRLPSDQPWRFPSPSHPLHSRARDVALTTLVAQTPKAVVDASPVNIVPQSGKASVFSTPNVVVFGKRKEPGTNALPTKNVGLGFTKPTPRRLFLSGTLPSPVSYERYRPATSRPNNSDFTPRASKSSSDFSLDTPARLPISNGLLQSASVEGGEDPFFDLYGSIVEFHKEQAGVNPPLLMTESPVIRTTKTAQSALGSRPFKSSGLGLMEAFSLKRDLEDDDDDADIGETEELLMSSPVARGRGSKSNSVNLLDLAYIDANVTDSPSYRPPMRKRRRTIAGTE